MRARQTINKQTLYYVSNHQQHLQWPLTISMWYRTKKKRGSNSILAFGFFQCNGNEKYFQNHFHGISFNISMTSVTNEAAQRIPHKNEALILKWKIMRNGWDAMSCVIKAIIYTHQRRPPNRPHTNAILWVIV